MTSAASTSPERTFSSASRRLRTGTRSTAPNSESEYVSTLIDSPPSGIVCCWGGISSRKATRGLSGPLESAKPISSAIAIG